MPNCDVWIAVDDWEEDCWGRAGVYSRGWGRRAFRKDDSNYLIRERCRIDEDYIHGYDWGGTMELVMAWTSLVAHVVDSSFDVVLKMAYCWLACPVNGVQNGAILRLRSTQCARNRWILLPVSLFAESPCISTQLHTVFPSANTQAVIRSLCKHTACLYYVVTGKCEQIDNKWSFRHIACRF